VKDLTLRVNSEKDALEIIKRNDREELPVEWLRTQPSKIFKMILQMLSSEK
jgi:hypothetical protein